MPQTEQLLDRVAAGDSFAANELMEQHRDRLRRMVNVRMDPRLAPRLDASDVVQEILTYAARHLPEYLHKRPISFYPWLRQIAWNQLMDLYRHHVLVDKRTVKREVEPAVSDASVDLLAGMVVAAGTSPTGFVVRRELRERVRQAINQLPARQREVLIMRHLEQLSIDEIAELLGMPAGTVKSRLFRGIQNLQLQLQSSYGESNHE